MGLNVRRVPLDFRWPLREVWKGFILPDSLEENPCPDCSGDGFSPHVARLMDLWHGKLPFSPESTGSTFLRPDTPAVRARAEQNVADDPDFFGTGEHATSAEAQRLADLWNSMWCHHLAQEDVDALAASGGLRAFAHPGPSASADLSMDPPAMPTAAQVNEWSLHNRHTTGNAYAVIRARCEREGLDYLCPTCGGRGSFEAHRGQREEAEAWKPTEPPKGDGWQLWETTSEGSPVSPVFGDAEGLAQWLATPEGRDACVLPRLITIEEARGLVNGTQPLTLINKDHGHHDSAS